VIRLEAGSGRLTQLVVQVAELAGRVHTDKHTLDASRLTKFLDTLN
jgi:hypothetical protein